MMILVFAGNFGNLCLMSMEFVMWEKGAEGLWLRCLYVYPGVGFAPLQ